MEYSLFIKNLAANNLIKWLAVTFSNEYQKVNGDVQVYKQNLKKFFQLWWKNNESVSSKLDGLVNEFYQNFSLSAFGHNNKNYCNAFLNSNYVFTVFKLDEKHVSATKKMLVINLYRNILIKMFKKQLAPSKIDTFISNIVNSLIAGYQPKQIFYEIVDNTTKWKIQTVKIFDANLIYHQLIMFDIELLREYLNESNLITGLYHSFDEMWASEEHATTYKKYLKELLTVNVGLENCKVTEALVDEFYDVFELTLISSDKDYEVVKGSYCVSICQTNQNKSGTFKTVNLNFSPYILRAMFKRQLKRNNIDILIDNIFNSLLANREPEGIFYHIVDDATQWKLQHLQGKRGNLNLEPAININQNLIKEYCLERQPITGLYECFSLEPVINDHVVALYRQNLRTLFTEKSSFRTLVVAINLEFFLLFYNLLNINNVDYKYNNKSMTSFELSEIIVDIDLLPDKKILVADFETDYKYLSDYFAEKFTNEVGHYVEIIVAGHKSHHIFYDMIDSKMQAKYQKMIDWLYPQYEQDMRTSLSSLSLMDTIKFSRVAYVAKNSNQIPLLQQLCAEIIEDTKGIRVFPYNSLMKAINVYGDVNGILDIEKINEIDETITKVKDEANQHHSLIN